CGRGGTRVGLTSGEQQQEYSDISASTNAALAAGTSPSEQVAPLTNNIDTSSFYQPNLDEVFTASVLAHGATRDIKLPLDALDHLAQLQKHKPEKQADEIKAPPWRHC